MIRIIIHGVNGYMGRVLTQLISESEDVEIAAGIDINRPEQFDYPFFTDLDSCDAEGDVLVDFSVAKAVDSVLDYCERAKVPGVICTTGLTDAQMERIVSISSRVAMLRSANMSLGVNTLISILSQYSGVFCDAGFDVEIVEKHHNRKLDAPSGTAIALADAINDSQGQKYTYEYDRSGRRQKRESNEIGIVSVRGGNIVGDHEVIFAGMDEVITLKHTATSRGVFALGAIEAAKYLASVGPGMYSMLDVVKA